MNYTDYISRNLEKNISYSEYVAEQIEKNISASNFSISYSEYVAEKIDKSINYSAYLDAILDNRKINRIKKIKNLFKI